MKEIKFNGHFLEMYDSIEELPIGQFQEYNRYILIDAGIGSNLDDSTSHIMTAARYIKNER